MMNYGIFFVICILFSSVLFLVNAAHHDNQGLRCKGKAYYTLTFQAEWSNETHPSPVFPTNAMFSPLVAATHSSAYEMWSRGKSASLGVQQVAETGETLRYFCEFT